MFAGICVLGSKLVLSTEESEYCNLTCTIGKSLDEECHQTFHCRDSGVIPAADLLPKDRELLEWRTGLILIRVIHHHHHSFCCP